MPTEAKTKKSPINLAYQARTQPILAFNQEGKIDVFLFDNTESEVDKLGLDKSKQIPLPLLANANILFNLSQELMLEPGLNASDDEQIIKYLKARLSDNILNPEVVMHEIITAWNFLAKHPLSERYAGFKDSDKETPLGYHGAYELMIHDYIAKYLATLSHFEFIETWLFVQANELVTSTLEGKVFSTNPYVKMDNLITTTEKCKKDIPDSAVVIDNIKQRLKREQGTWYTTLVGLIGFELENLLEEEKLKPKQQEIIFAFQQLLAGKYDKIEDKEVMEYLQLILRCLKNPGEEGFYNNLVDKRTNQGPTHLQIRQAIESLIVKKLKDYKLTLDKKRPSSLLELAGSSAEDEEKLLKTLFDPAVNFTPAMLTSIKRKARSEVVRDTATVKLEMLDQRDSQPHQRRPSYGFITFS